MGGASVVIDVENAKRNDCFFLNRIALYKYVMLCCYVMLKHISDPLDFLSKEGSKLISQIFFCQVRRKSNLTALIKNMSQRLPQFLWFMAIVIDDSAVVFSLVSVAPSNLSV